MATKPDTITGTLDLISGSINFTTVGTNLITRGHLPGDEIYVPSTGSWLIIETITGENAGTLRYPCPTACAGTGLPVTIRFQPDGSRVKAEARNLVDELGNGNIASLASLDGTGGDFVVTFAGPHSLELVPANQFVSGADYDVQVANLAARAAYDGEVAGFSVLVSNIGDGRAAIYSKNSLTSGDWSDPAFVTGDVGPMPTLAVDDTTTLSPGSPATVVVTPVLGGYELDFGIPEGIQGDMPTLTVDDVVTLPPGDPVSVVFSPVVGGYEIDFGIPKGDTGNGLEIDALGPLASRSTHDAEPEGFVFFDTDTGELYLRYTATPGVWEGPYPFQGPPGASGSLITTTNGVGNGTVGPYTLVTAPIGLDSIITASISGVNQYDFSVLGNQITFGQIVPVGLAWQVKSAGPLSVGVPANDSVNAAKIDGTDAVAIRAKIGAGTGDVVGPASAVADRIALYNGTTGKLIKDGGLLLNDLVKYNSAQSKTAAEQGQARANIGGGMLAGLRNKLINGDYAINQRGFSAALAGATVTYTLDRWVGYFVHASDTLTISQSPIGVADIDLGRSVEGFSINLTMTGSNGLKQLFQRIENVRTLANRRITLSFWVYNSNAAVNINPLIVQDFGGGGSGAVNTAFVPVALAAGAWTYVAQTVVLPAITGKTIGTNSSLTVYLLSDNLSSRTLIFSKASLVEGDATAEADPFSPRHIQQELALCQRFYQKPVGRWIIYAPSAGAGGSAYATFALQTKMRAAPSIAKSGEISVNASAMAFTSNPDYVEGTITITASGPGYTFTFVALDAEL